ncbi:MAG: helix-turn-helix domain-containing protein, partial [Steroidobacteraceae bacterium]
MNLFEDETRSYSGARDDRVERYPGAVLCGAYSHYFVIDTREQRANVGVGFRPGGTWPFFDPAGDELQNQHVALRDLWGAAGDTLRERILAAPTPRAKLLLLEAELLQRAIRPLQRRAEVDFAISRLAQAPHDYTIAMLSEHVGLSARRFTRLFTLEVGLTPKLYARVQRFQRVLECMQDSAARDWTEVAQDCGYFDQSHLIRECRSMSGCTPTELAARRIGASVVRQSVLHLSPDAGQRGPGARDFGEDVLGAGRPD